MSERYTVVAHHAGCRIVEGESIPMADAAALLTAWSKRGDNNDPVICSTDLPRALTIRSGRNVVLVVGKLSEVEALTQALNSETAINTREVVL